MKPMIYLADSYKYSHFGQYEPTTKYVVSYIESRGSDFNEAVFFGLQGFINTYMTVQITEYDVYRMKARMEKHGVSFNFGGWMRIVEKHNGLMPVKIDAVKEGTIVPTRNAMVRIINTDPELPWVTSFVETALLRAIWYPTTVATVSRESKKVIAKYMDATAGHRDGLEFMLHDFGARGVSSHESAQIGGAAHLVNFLGTDTQECFDWLEDNAYIERNEVPAFSVDATEHSTVTTWGRSHEVDMYRAYLATATSGKILSCVSDSYNIYDACEKIWGGELREEVMALGTMGARLVVRPDSGDPIEVPNDCVEILMERFGYAVNGKGYKVLPSYIRVLQGDGINIHTIEEILAEAMGRGFSAENFVFGMGGALLQHSNRDTLKFAQKACAAFVDGNWIAVFKEPVDDKGKASKKGIVAFNGKRTIEYLPETEDPYATMVPGDLLQTVYNDGKVGEVQLLQDIRDRAKI